jgi:hypothetical protein
MRRPNYHNWTASDDAALRRGFAYGERSEAIARKLCVTLAAVHNRAKTLSQPHRFMRRTLEQRWWDHVSPEPNTGCWLWDGANDRKGYGQLRVAGRNRVATHISLELIGLKVPVGRMALHTCDMPPCVNPDHLFIGTARRNTADMTAKGRHRGRFVPRAR